MTLGSWDKEGVIDKVDGQLKRLQKERYRCGANVSQHHVKTHDRRILRAGRQEGR